MVCGLGASPTTPPSLSLPASHQRDRRVGEARRHLDPLHPLPERLLGPVQEGLERRGGGRGGRFLGVVRADVEPFARNVDKLLPFKLGHRVERGLVDGLGQVEHFKPFGREAFDKGRGGRGGGRIGADVEHVALALLHAGHVVAQGGEAVAGRGGWEAEERGQ